MPHKSENIVKNTTTKTSKGTSSSSNINKAKLLLLYVFYLSAICKKKKGGVKSSSPVKTSKLKSVIKKVIEKNIAERNLKKIQKAVKDKQYIRKLIIDYLDQKEDSHTLRKIYVRLWSNLFGNVNDLIDHFRNKEYDVFFKFIGIIEPKKRLISYYVILLNFWTKFGDQYIKSFFRQKQYGQYTLEPELSQKINFIVDICWQYIVNNSTRFPDITKYEEPLNNETKYCILLTILTKYYYFRKIQKKYKDRNGFKLFFGTNKKVIDSITTKDFLIPQSASFELEEACNFLKGDKAILAMYNFNPKDNIEKMIYIPVAIDNFSEFATENETLFIPVKTFGDTITIMPKIGQKVLVRNISASVNYTMQKDDDSLIIPIFPTKPTDVFEIEIVDIPQIIHSSAFDAINLDDFELDDIVLDDADIDSILGIIETTTDIPIPHIPTTGGCNKCKKYNKTKKKLLYI